MTAGIKLTNLRLRDGDDNWQTANDWYIGDMVPKSKTDKAPQNETLGTYLLKHRDYTTADSYNNITYHHGEDVSVGAPWTSNTLQDFVIPNPLNLTLECPENEEGELTGDLSLYYTEEQVDSDGNSTTNKVQLGEPVIGVFRSGLKDLWVENGIAIWDYDLGHNTSSVHGESGSSEGYSSNVDNITIRMVNGKLGLRTVAVNTSSLDKQMAHGQTLPIITDIKVDSYGRVTDITKQFVTFPIDPSTGYSDEPPVSGALWIQTPQD